MQKVPVGRLVQREVAPCQHIPGLDQRQVEGLSVERDHRREAAEQLPQASQKSLLFVVVPHEVLPDPELLPLKESHAHQEDVGSSAARQSGCLCVDEGEALQVHRAQRRIPSQAGYGGRTKAGASPQRDPAVRRTGRVTGLNQEEPPLLVLQHRSADHLL